MSFFRENRDLWSTHLWWGHIDGELTPAESAEFDRSLSDEERARLVGDAEVEHELAEIFSESAACPKEAWKLALRQINEAKQEENPPRTARRFIKRALVVVMPLAACFLIGISIFMYVNKPESQKAWFLDINDQEAEHTQVPDKCASVRELLEKQKMPLAFDPSNSLEDAAAPYQLLGARENKFQEQTIVELFFNCDGKPAKVVIVPRGGTAAEQFGKGLARGTIRAARTIGNNLIAVVGEGAPRDLIGVLEDPFAPKKETPPPPPLVEEVKKPDIQSAVEDKTGPEDAPPDLPVNMEDATPTLPNETGASTVV